MPDGFVCVRLEAVSASAGRNQFLHDVREKAPKYLKTPPKILFRDFRGYHRNRLIGGEKSVEAIKQLHWELEKARKMQLQEFHRAHGRKMPRGTRPYIRVLLAFSHSVERIDLAALVDAADKFFLALSGKYDLPLLYYALHEDEKTRHFHALLENYDYENNLTRFRNLGRPFFSTVQDLAELYFRPLGFIRGLAKALTRTHHVGIRQAHEEEAILLQTSRILSGDPQRLFSIAANRIEEVVSRSSGLYPLDILKTKEDGPGGTKNECKLQA